MTSRRTNCYDQALACDIFDKFCNASKLKEVLSQYKQLCQVCKLCPTNFPEFYPKLKAKVPSWRANELWSKLEKKASHPSYGRGKFCHGTRVLIIGGGPCGLRTAIECQLLGAKTVLIEKRNTFSRNNVLHLWPFTITDLRNLGAKQFYGKFCAGSIDHISIRRLQCILLKIALLLGVEVHEGVSFEELIEPQDENDLGWKASVLPKEHPVAHFHFDVVIGADGRRSTLPGFRRKALRAKLAIAITANFINNHTEAEARVQEISGVSYIFKQQFFQELDAAMGIALENIVYYKDETHYFVMTPTKQSLLEKGVIYQDFSDPEQLLSPENVDPEALQLFTMQAVVFATDNRLPDLQFARNHRGEPDVALFDFTTMYASENACRVIERKGHKLLTSLVGDSLLEPFWPTGSGLARGFLGAFDAAWMTRSWGKGLKSVLEVISERESIYRLLGQTTTENLNKDHNQYSIDPATRYPNINTKIVGPRQVMSLYDCDVKVEDIFISIRESKRSRIVPEVVLLKWFKEHLRETHIEVRTLLDILNDGNALCALVNRFRPDLVEFPMEFSEQKSSGNELAFEALQEEYEIPTVITAEESIKVAPKDTLRVIHYLSQVYHAFKGEIPRSLTGTEEEEEEDEKQGCNDKNTTVSYPNNSALHHSLSIKQFLQAKESLKEKKAKEEAQSKRERRKSQFFESIMQTESNYNQQRSTSSVNIPVVKLNPVPPGELFSACRGGSDRVTVDRSVETDPIEIFRLKRSKSDIGYKNLNYLPKKVSSLSQMYQSKPSPGLNGHIINSGRDAKLSQSRFPLAHSQSKPQIPTGALLSQNNGLLSDRSELEEMQLRIRKTKVTPFGDIVSTFLGKHINQNSDCSTNGESDENPLLSNERRHLRPARPQSLYQNVNDCPSSSPNYKMEDQENDDCDSGTPSPTRPTASRLNNPFLNPDPDPGFKERCKFLEKNLYNSGRDIKVHIGAAWFAKEDSKKNNPSMTSSPLQKSVSSAAVAGFHPLKRGSSFNVRSKMEESFGRPMVQPSTAFLAASRNKQESFADEGGPGAFLLPKEVREQREEFLSKKLGGLVDRHVPDEWKTPQRQKISPSQPTPKSGLIGKLQEKPKNDQHRPSFPGHRQQTNFHQPIQQSHHQGKKNHLHPHNHCQQSGTAENVKLSQTNNKGKWQKGEKIDGESSSSAVDSDLDCFLNTIDFGRIDSQDLQELLSSY